MDAQKKTKYSADELKEFEALIQAIMNLILYKSHYHMKTIIA
jgi:hypothetical protein